MSLIHHIELQEPQAEVLTSDRKFHLFCGGLGSGKTFTGAQYTINRAISNPEALGFVGANTYTQLENSTLSALYERLTALQIPFEPMNTRTRKMNINGAQVLCMSLEKYNVLRGVELGWAWVDEVRDLREDAWKVLMGRLRDKRSHALEARLTTTPSGYNWLHDYFVGDKCSEKFAMSNASTWDNPHLPDDYAETLQEQYDDQMVEQELKGQFINLKSGKRYYKFDRSKCVQEFEPQKDFPIYVGMDFNVNPMTATVMQVWGSSIMQFDEFYLKHSNTYDMADEILRKYGFENVYIIPDATGQAEKTSAKKSDHDILREYKFKVLTKSVNPHRKDRFNCMNGLFQRARYVIHPRCKWTIGDFEKTADLEPKDSMLGHISDAAGYPAWHFFPIQKERKEATQYQW